MSRRRRLHFQMTIFYKSYVAVLIYPIAALLFIEKVSFYCAYELIYMNTHLCVLLKHHVLSYTTSIFRHLDGWCFGILCISDICRYYLGTSGNQNRQVFQLTAFLSLAVFPMMPTLLYCFFLAPHCSRFDTIAGVSLTLLSLLETVFGFRVLKELVRNETIAFTQLRDQKIWEQEDEQTRKMTTIQ